MCIIHTHRLSRTSTINIILAVVVVCTMHILAQYVIGELGCLAH